MTNNYNNNKNKFKEFDYIKSLHKMDKSELVIEALTQWEMVQELKEEMLYELKANSDRKL